MKHSLLPLGGAVVATGLLAAALSGTAQAKPDWATDKMAGSNSSAVSVVDFWAASNFVALKKATSYSPDAATPRLSAGGGYSPDGRPGTIAPIGAEKAPAARVKNVNLPKTLGKVFFVANGEYRWCSATSIQSRYRNLVATAAHCVYDTASNGDTLDKWVFVPGYYQGKVPWGMYVGKQAWTHYDFDVFEDYDKDYAFVTVYNGVAFDGVKKVSKADYDRFSGPKWGGGSGYYVVLSKDVGRLGDNVGGQGFTWNQSTGKPVYAFGYPQAPHPDGNKPYSGVTPKYVYGKPSGKVYVSAAEKVEEHVGLKGAFTPGADGGPWLTQYSSSRRLGYVNGVTSLFGDQDKNNRYDLITSPYFDGETADIYKKAANVWSGRIVGPNGELYK
ncbi:trypsin-like serine peptidase [Streptosporangium sp. CA-135522]|uniref:trypsin-like serine peptidase n=1 Tax=Streptosporangium sp. CA-135522 TaxID=3240072 RepID=UPI003D8D1808